MLSIVGRKCYITPSLTAAHKTMTTQNISKAAAILRAGGLVAFPTETVYGLGADARNEAALRKIFQAKERPYDHPLIVHIASIEQLGDWAREIPADAIKLAQAFWPGGLTLILKKQPNLPAILTAGQDTVGIRIPAHPVAQELIKSFGSGIAAPSANKFTHISPTTASAVEEELGGAVDLIIDGGECAIGLESTILDMSSDQPIVLRPGMITAERIAQVLSKPVLAKAETQSTIKVPGMHHLHYAPNTKTRLLKTAAISTFQTTDLPCVLVTYSDVKPPAGITHIQMPNQPDLYAHDIYRMLRDLDHQQYKCIILEEVPTQPAWEAIRDRLNKASSK